MDHRDLRVQLAPQGMQVNRDQPVLSVTQDQLEVLGRADRLALPVQSDQRAMRDLQAALETPDLLDHKGHRGHLDHRDFKDRQEMLDSREVLGHKECPVLLDQQVHREHLAMRVSRVPLDHLVHQVL